MGTQSIFLLLRQIGQLADLGQGQRETRDRRSRKAAAVGNLPIAQAHASTLEAAQDVECARYDLYDLSVFRADPRPLLRHQFLRSTSHRSRSKTSESYFHAGMNAARVD